MATLVLQSAGQALGGLIGGPAGALLGRAAGAIAGSLVDQALFGPPDRKIEGPRLSDLHVMGSSEGAPIARLWGRARIAGQLIWAVNFEEVISSRKQNAGGKGSLGGPKTKVTEYSYFASFAVGLAEGEITRIGRIWADGKEIDPSGYTWRLYTGSPDQQPDALITAKEGPGNAPAYRDTAYVVFERLPLEKFGNRLPQLTFEVFRALAGVEDDIRAVNIIPGATEFGYDTNIVTRKAGWGETQAENTHTVSGKADWPVSIDQLTATCPQLGAAALVATWFGDDLRCGHCQIRPGIESTGKDTSPVSWSVAGTGRSGAHLISQHGGGPAFGSSPDDTSVLNAIADLQARGLKVMFYPFIMMDVPAANTLPDPYTGTPGQPAYPWRGQLTCDPAPGRTATPDKTAGIQAQVDAFFGTAAVADFSIAGGAVVYSGPAEWGLRRMILHYASLCALAGSVDAFLIASELKGLTLLRNAASQFPVVSALRALAGDVAAILPGVKISYGADWSEYFGYHPGDGSGDVFFHLDDFWSSPDVHFIGIDNYMPLSDWRDGSEHTDALAGVRSIYDHDYLKANVAGGEGFDWYYASDADRELQQRTPITDGAYSKPWMFRFKDLKSWWENAHYDRPGGIESTTPTAWQPQSKPFWFTEAGCPAIDKGANQPNVFYDPKSSQSAVPRFSSGVRDDFMQRCFIEALLAWWSGPASANPLSSVYGKAMVDTGSIFLWSWDARPFPAFPYLTQVWSDGVNYERGHWLNGRLGSVALEPLVRAILAGAGLTSVVFDQVSGVIDGYVIERAMSARQALDPLFKLFSFDAIETEGRLALISRAVPASAAVSSDDLAETGPQAPLLTLTRAQETELPQSLKLDFIDPALDYRRTSVETRRLTGHSARQLTLAMPVVTGSATARARAGVLLQEIWAGRETAAFALPPSLLRLEPGDTIDLASGGRTHALRIEQVSEAGQRRMVARHADAGVYEAAPAPARTGQLRQPAVYGPPRHAFLDIPVLRAGDVAGVPWLAAGATPWPGSMSVLAAQDTGSFAVNRQLGAPAVMGTLLAGLPAGPRARWDRAARVQVQVYSGALNSVSETALLGGENLAAIGTSQTGWEIIQFASAVLTGPDTYELSLLLRGQYGTEAEMAAGHVTGALFVLLDPAVIQLDLTTADIGRTVTFRIGPAGRDHADASYVESQLTPQGIGLRPFSPVHLKAVRNGSDLDLSWIRRTRSGGDAWQLAEVPLSEDAESYEVDILSGTTVVRTLTASGPQTTYTAAQQTTDFGAPVTGPLNFRVSQISSAFGRGTPTEKIAHV